MAYDRDEFIRLLTDYYEFCGRIFWHDTTLKKAPDGGWPSTSQDTLANLKKNDIVIDLLRHMPYPDVGFEYGGRPIIMFDTPVVDYRDEKTHKEIEEDKLTGFTEPYQHSPSSCVGIAMTRSRNGYWIIFNTDDGRMYWGNPDGKIDEEEPELNDLVEEEKGSPEPGEDWWWGFNIYEPADFFAICKQRFREMSWIGIDRHNIKYVTQDMRWEYQSDLEPENEDEHDRMARKMVALGWPGDGEGTGWDRERFIDAINEPSDGEEEME